MNIEQELAQWREDWRASTPKGGEQGLALEKKVRSQGLRMRLYLAFELMTSACFLMTSAYVSWRNPTPPNIVWAVAVWIFTLVVQGFSLRIQRGLWSPSSQDTRAFLQLSLQRCHAILRGIKFCIYVIAAELAFLLFWFSWSFLYRTVSVTVWINGNLLVLFLALLLSLGFLLFFAWLRKKKVREIASLEDMKRSIELE
jgi:hypothetical protein